MRIVFTPALALALAFTSHTTPQSDANNASGTNAWIGGGASNSATGVVCSIGGGEGNRADGVYGAITGGQSNTITTTSTGTLGGHSAIGGGYNNKVTATCGVIPGGSSNSASGYSSVVGGGWLNTGEADFSVIAGGSSNSINADAATSVIGGGKSNTAAAQYSIIGGGYNNFGGGYASSIGGGGGNAAASRFGVVAGGYTNFVSNDSHAAFIGGGYTNSVHTANQAVVAGGRSNTATGGDYAVIGGGLFNIAHSKYGVNAGGYANYNSAVASSIGGGWGNNASSPYAAIAGGYFNSITGVAEGSAVGGGKGNLVHSSTAVVAGGYSNMVTNDGSGSFIGGGHLNIAESWLGVVSGGYSNTNSGYVGAVCGGRNNTLVSDAGVIGGGASNTASSKYGVISGGFSNSNSGVASSIGGGWRNNASAASAVIAGGEANAVSPVGSHSAVGGGYGNRASGVCGVVAGGNSNSASGFSSVVAGGLHNTIASSYAVIGGGESNNITSNSGESFIGGGQRNTADSRFSVVAGGYSGYGGGYASAIGGGGNNEALSPFAVVGGGYTNVISGDSYTSCIGGGYTNSVQSADSAVIAGGRSNTAAVDFAVVGGGFNNVGTGYGSAVGGGVNNNAETTYAVIAGGRSNAVDDYVGTVGGGAFNTVSAKYGVIAGGYFNSNSGLAISIGGGWRNNASASYAVIAGGESNVVTAFGGHSAIGGGCNNSGAGYGITIGGGVNNDAASPLGVVAGGRSNSAHGYASSIAGGWNNIVNSSFSVIAGGTSNINDGYASTIGGGHGNSAALHYTTVAGGNFNSARGYGGTIGGGQDNVVSLNYTVISGGLYNSAVSTYAVVGGGHENVNNGYASIIGGGEYNFADAAYAVIAGGRDNNNTGHGSAIGGGCDNLATSGCGVVSGGCYNSNAGTNGVVGGGIYNSVSGLASTVSGGQNNVAMSNFTVVGGGLDNSASFLGAVVGGGRGNDVTASWSAIAGGRNNLVAAAAATIGGGTHNSNIGDGAVIAGGVFNQAAGRWSTISGGRNNTLQSASMSSVIAGGKHNSVDAAFAVIAGGQGNVAAGTWSVVGGGAGNSALGANSLAQGTAAVAEHNWAAVLSFSASNETCRSPTNSTITLCADNGVFVNGHAVTTADEVIAITHRLAVLDTAVNVSAANISSNHARIGNVADSVNVLTQWNQRLWRNASQQQMGLDSLASKISEVNTSTLDHASLIKQQSENIEQLQIFLGQLNETVAAQAAECTGRISEQTAAIARQSATIEDLNASFVLLNETVHSQNALLDAKDAIVATQRVEIESLRDAIHNMNSSLTSLTTVVEQILSSTSFVPSTYGAVVDSVTTIDITDCQPSHHPCRAATSDAGPHAGANGTVTVPAETTLESSAVSVRACNAFPCTGSPDVFAWSSTVTVVATSNSDATTAFHFTLSSSAGDTVWQATTQSRFASFVPSDLDISSSELYHVHLSADIEESASRHAISEVLRFAPPPTLHDVSARRINGTAAADWFQVVVNASDVTAMLYEFWVVDAQGQWQYLADSSPSHSIVITVPSTRNATLKVVVTNSFGSETSCAECAMLYASLPSNVTVNALLQDALELVRGGIAGSSLLLAAVDVVDGPSDVETILAAFAGVLNTNTTVLSQDVVLLQQLAELAPSAGGMRNAIQAVGSRLTNGASPQLLELYLDAIDSYTNTILTTGDAVIEIAEMDGNLENVCSADVAGSIPSGAVTAYTKDVYSLACGRNEDVVAFESNEALVVAVVDGLSNVALSSWNYSTNVTNTTLLASIHGLHVSHVGDEGSYAELRSAITLKVTLSHSSTAVRKVASCMYYDEVMGVWHGRGVVMRGMELTAQSRLRVICESSHLTLFSVGDSSELATVVETKVQALADRVQSMNNVNFLDDGSSINWNIFGVFLGVTVVFAIVVSMAKAIGRSSAVKLGRITFERHGRLSKPSVMGSVEYEAVLRRWTGGCNAVKFVLMEVVTSNAVLGLLFHWDHEAVVFGRADKAVILYGAVLMTFVSSAFLFNPTEQLDGNLLMTVWSNVVAAVLANVLLLPVQHFLPYMVSNVNSLTTMTNTPTTLIQQEMRRRSCCTLTRRKHRRCQVELQSRVIVHWLNFMQRQRQPPTKQRSEGVSKFAGEKVSTQLYFLHCPINLQSLVRVGRSHADLQWGLHPNSVIRSLVHFQRALRTRMSVRRETRSLEFETWYTVLRPKRHMLAVLSTTVVVILAAFTMAVCLLLSGAFNNDESVMWVTDVGQSLAVQIFVTDPSITLVVVATKLWLNWVLLRSGNAHKKQLLRTEQQVLERQILTAKAGVQTMQAKASALRLVCNGSRPEISRKLEQKRAAKKRFEVALDDIAMAKVGLSKRRLAVAKPKIGQLQEWDAQASNLTAQETTTQHKLQSVQAAIEVLQREHSDIHEQLRLAQEALARMHRKVDKLSDANSASRYKLASIDARIVQHAAKRSAIVPTMQATTVVDEPDTERTKMRPVKSAAERQSDSSAHSRNRLDDRAHGAQRPHRRKHRKSAARTQRRRGRGPRHIPTAVERTRTQSNATHRGETKPTTTFKRRKGRG